MRERCKWLIDIICFALHSVDRQVASGCGYEHCFSPKPTQTPGFRDGSHPSCKLLWREVKGACVSVCACVGKQAVPIHHLCYHTGINNNNLKSVEITKVDADEKELQRAWVNDASLYISRCSSLSCAYKYKQTFDTIRGSCCVWFLFKGFCSSALRC